MIIGWTLSRHRPDFPLGRPSSQTERFTCFIILPCILEGFTRYYYIVACTCQHSPVTLLHRSDFPNALTVRDHRADPPFGAGSFLENCLLRVWFARQIRFTGVVEKKWRVQLVPTNSNEINRKFFLTIFKSIRFVWY